MTRALIHIGLALAVVLAPTLCCCQAGWFVRPAQAAHVSAPVPQPVAPAKTCCERAAHVPAPTHTPAPASAPEPRHAPDCACCVERPDAAPPETQATETPPQPTGEYLALESAGAFRLSEHRTASDCSRADRPGGADVKYAALFERHVLRC